MSACCDPNPIDLEERWNTGARSTAACGVLTFAGWATGAYAGAPGVATALFALACLAGGWAAFGRTVKALAALEVDVDLLMLLAAAGAAVVGHWMEGAVLLFLFSLGTTLETYAFGRTRRSIQALMELRPTTATLVEATGTRTVPIEELAVGDVVRVVPGDRIPADGTVQSGTSRIDESTLTGEPVPVKKEPGAEVFSGTLNGNGSLDIVVGKTAEDSALARVIQLVEEAREARAPTQSWIEDVEGRYAVGVIVAAGLAILIPWLAMGWAFDDAFYRAMTLLVVASPCALVISIPATIVSAVSNGARRGVLFKGGAHLDALADVEAIAFDKTGTLTVGRPELDRIVALAPVGVGAEEPGSSAEDEVLRLVASAESRSEHPLASALVAAARSRGLELTDPDDFEAVPGKGVVATVEGRRIAVGRRAWVEATTGPLPATLAEAFDESRTAGTTPIVAALDGRAAATMAVADRPRPGAKEALAAMHRAGVEHLAMLTGDDRGTAEAIAARLGIDDIAAELLPETKTDAVKSLQRRYGRVAMVGDGVNDAPALAMADVGIALGAAGTDVALETADVVVMGERLDGIAHALDLSRRARAIVRQNLVFAVGVMGTLVTLALLGKIGLTAGVVGHEGSTIVVVFNGLRLLADRGAA